MCGILGVIGPAGRPLDLSDAQLQRMRDTMAARGPDAAGLFRRQGVGLAHRRLAIRDLEGGRQPCVSHDGQTVLVYNGEIYNDGPLRRDLVRLGHRFQDRCDTSVVLAAYREWGPACLERLRGMFALGIYDFRDDSLLLARDRFGIKPLYVSQLGGQLVFASTIAAILAHPACPKQPNLAVASHYLSTLRLTLGRETLYEGVWQLLPGERLHWQEGHARVESYWSYPPEENAEHGYDEAAADLGASLAEAVQVRLASDVPVGMFLSGGVDSNLLASLLREQHGDPLIAACGGGDVKGADFTAAERAAQLHGFQFHPVRSSAATYLETWQSLVSQLRTPLSTPSDVILHRLALHMKRHVGVVLGGEGADELLGGYAVQHWSGQDYAASRQLAAGCWAHGTAAGQVVLEGLRKQYGRDQFSSPSDHYFALNSLIPPQAKPALWQSWAWQQAEEDRRMWDYYQLQFRQLADLPPVRQTLHLLHRINLEALLARLDSATMQAGLEARVPYTDHLLVERVWRMPSAFKIDVAPQEREPYRVSSELQARGTLRSKRLLRTLAAKLMPAELADRPKASFPTPLQQWLPGPWRQWAADQLSASPFLHAIFQPATLAELHANVDRAGMWLWPLLNLSLWGDAEFAGGRVAEPRQTHSDLYRKAS